MNLPVFVLLVCLTTYGDTKQQDEVKSIIQQSSAKNLLHRVIREGDLSGAVNVSVSKVMNISTGHKSEKTLVPLTAHGTGELGSQAVSDSGPNNVTNPGNRNATASDPKKVGADPAPAASKGADPAPAASKGADPAPAASKGAGPAPAASKGAGPAPSASEHQPNNQQGDKGNVKVQDPTIPDPNEEEEMNESKVLGDREDDDNEVATADEDESEDAGNKVGPNAIREKAIDQLSKEDSESSHFFAYLVTTAILVTVLYIAYHNKRKIIAYVLEGRRGKGGRRPNSGEYQRLDHKI